MSHRREYAASHGSLQCDVIDTDTNEVVERINFTPARVAAEDGIPADIMDIYTGRVSSPLNDESSPRNDASSPHSTASSPAKKATAKAAKKTTTRNKAGR